MKKISNYKKIKNCRLCNSQNLREFISFGDISLGNNLSSKKSIAKSSEEYPLKINRCENCAHFQLSASVKPEILYAKNYTYLSSIGKSFRLHQVEYYKWAKEKCNLNKGSFVVDIGSNDGACLKVFKSNGCKVIGVDPAEIPVKLANKSSIKTYLSFFNSKIVDLIIKENGQPDFITSQNVLAHIEDLKDVFLNIQKLLKEGGYFAFEIGYFKSVLESGCFDTTYHEHLDYHHASPLTRHLISIGFDILDLSINNIQGGSLRLLCKKSKVGNAVLSKNAIKFLEKESHSELYNQEFLFNWKNSIKSNMFSLSATVNKHIAEGKIVAGYGCPTKATLLMKMSNLNETNIKYVVEDNDYKVGRFMPKSGIEIIGFEEFLNKKPDVLIIFAWNFSSDILKKLKIKVDWDLTCIVPLPNLSELKLC